MHTNTTQDHDKAATIVPSFDFSSDRLTRQEAAEYLGVSKVFLARDAVTHRHGVPFFKIGTKVFYTRTHLNEWVAARKVA